MNSAKYAALGALAAGLFSCAEDGEGGPGTLRVQLQGEESITGEISVGTEEEQTRDCSVTYQKYLVAIGRVGLANTKASAMRSDPAVFIADMKGLGETGATLATFTDIPSGQWESFSFETPIASAEAQTLGAVTPQEREEMVAKGLTYWIEGTVVCPERTVSFKFQVAVPTVYHQCQSDGEPGVAVSAGGTSTATVTLHGDHLWFDSLPSAAEGTVNRRAAWILHADPDGDGMVDTADLAAVRAEVAFPSSLGYRLDGAEIANALDFVKAQLRTQGHLNVEGECLWSAP